MSWRMSDRVEDANPKTQIKTKVSLESYKTVVGRFYFDPTTIDAVPLKDINETRTTLGAVVEEFQSVDGIGDRMHQGNVIHVWETQ